MIDVLVLRLALIEWVVLVNSVVVVKGVLTGVKVLLVNAVGWDTVRFMTSGRSCCVSTAVTEALLCKSLFLCSREYLLESLALI